LPATERSLEVEAGEELQRQLTTALRRIEELERELAAARRREHLSGLIQH
jgi:hypothetical protein